MIAAGAPQMADQFRGIGLHEALVVVPIALLITGVALLVATRTFSADARAMRGEQARLPSASGARAGSAA